MAAPVTVCLSEDTSQSLLSYMENAGGAAPEAVSRFVEEAVSRRLFEMNSQKVRDRFSDMTPEGIEDLVEEALAWARSPEGRACE